MISSRDQPRFNILFTSVGRRIALIQAFRRALRSLNLEGTLYGVDVTSTAPALYVLDRAFPVPPVAHPDYLETLLDLCRVHQIHLLVPLIDPELLLLAQQRERFAAEGTTVLISDPQTIEIGQDKFRTTVFFQTHNLPTPLVYSLDQVEVDQISFPVVVKPVRGSAGKGVRVVHNLEQLKVIVRETKNPIIQQKLEGQEHTLDVLVDFEGRVRCVVPRRRVEVRSGEVSKAVTVKHPRIIETGKRAVEALPGARGPITVQGFLTPDGEFSLIEINPRFGGGHPLAIAAGADFPRWVIQWTLGYAPEALFNDWEEGLWMLRYDEAFFVKGSKLTWST